MILQNKLVRQICSLNGGKHRAEMLGVVCAVRADYRAYSYAEGL